jgi:peptidoglycan hydrolase-like protein with peptidoglycan-binding domain
MHGEKIAEIQRQLELHGYDPGTVDGIFGPKTFAAALSFQRAHGLLTDGEVGPQTAKALGIKL